jgi:AraC-like DNA-binding protein
MKNTVSSYGDQAFPGSSQTRVRELFLQRFNLLCIEDNIEICDLLCESIFPSPLFNVKPVNSPEAAKAALSGNITFHAWILDLSLKKHNDGMELLKLRPNFPFCVVLSGAQSMDDATAAIKAGVFSAHDKKSIFAFDPHPFISEVCALSAASFLLKARKPPRFDLYQLLLREFIPTPDDWSTRYCMNERTLRNICEEDSHLTPKQFLSFFHALNSLLISDCIVDSMKGSAAVRQALVDQRGFYDQCLDYVLRNIDPVYGPLFLEI